MAKKVKHSNAPTDRERIESLERNLSAAVREHHRLRREMDELRGRDPLQDLKSALRQQSRRTGTGELPKPYQDDLRYDPDDTVN